MSFAADEAVRIRRLLLEVGFAIPGTLISDPTCGGEPTGSPTIIIRVITNVLGENRIPPM